MADTRILEVMIASDDHRMLSANAEAWWLVQNDVFMSFESFLTDESKQVFLDHLTASDTSWFLTFFSREPDHAYLTRIEPDAEHGPGSPIRIVLTRLDQLMDDHLHQGDVLISYDTMLSFHDDLYYEYFQDTNQFHLYNIIRSHFTRSLLSMEEFHRMLQQSCHPDSLPLLEDWMDHLKKGTPRFRLNIPCNLINREDHGIYSVVVRGRMVHHRSGKSTLVGILHPIRMRGTEEKAISYDALTGAVAREHVIRIAQDRINRLQADGTAIAILDLDYFKHVNDNYGHQYGDEILRRVTAVVQEEIRSAGIVGRIGGDEFMLLFYHIRDELELRAFLRSIKSVIAATMENITVSIGAAIFPNDAGRYDDVFMVADYCLYLAKEKGRNRYVIHNLEKHPPVDEIRKIQTDGERYLIRGRDDLPLGEALVQMQYLFRNGKCPPLAALLNEFATRAGVPLLSVWRRDDRSLVAAGGKEKQDADALRAFFAEHAPDELYIDQYVTDGMCIVNTVEKYEEGYLEVRKPLVASGVGSYICIPYTDPDGIPAALIFAVVHRKVFWNQQQYVHFRLFADLVAACRISEQPAG